MINRYAIYFPEPKMSFFGCVEMQPNESLHRHIATSSNKYAVHYLFVRCTIWFLSTSHAHLIVSQSPVSKFTERAWDYCNDSCRLDLSVRYHPEIIVSSIIYVYLLRV